MRKVKKAAAFLISTALTFSILTGCGSGGGQSSSATEGEKQELPLSAENPEAQSAGEAITITLGMHVANVDEQEPVTANIIKAFEEVNPDIRVEIQGNDKDEHVKKMKMAAQANELPDIFWMDSSVAPELSEAGLLLDLSEFLNQYPEAAAGLDNNMKEANSLNGVQYGLPYQSLVTGIWYNKALFSQYGLEEPKNGTTYEELLEMVRVFSENGITPIAQGAKDTYSIWAFLIAMERYGYFGQIDAILKGETKFNNPEFVKFFEKLEELGKEKAFPENCATMTYFQAKEEFVAGKAAMFDSGIWDAGELDGSLGENAGFWCGPVFADTDVNQQVKMKVSSAPFCVSAGVGEDEAKKEAVYRFLEFYYGEEAAKISYEGSMIPATNYKVDIDMSGKPAFSAAASALADEAWTSPVAQPDLVLKEAVQAQLYDSIYGTMLGNYTPAEALDKMDTVLSQQ